MVDPGAVTLIDDGQTITRQASKRFVLNVGEGYTVGRPYSHAPYSSALLAARNRDVIL
ncbi:MAG TPA: hypothetical protein VGJ87_02445 [Roseiflexaceae bacterium]